jgi:hypothetical protein
MARKRQTDTAAVTKATADLHRALREAADARRRLARATQPGAPYRVVAPHLRWADAILDARGKSLKRIPGVIGYGLGTALKGGHSTAEECITVFVRKKRTSSELRRAEHRVLPKSISAGGKKIRVDVVEIGGVKLHADRGGSIGPAGDPLEREGTIGAFATDLVTERLVAITAMHVTGQSAFTGAVEFRIPSLRLHSATARLGDVTFGTTDGIDAAKIDLDDQNGGDNGFVQGWRPPAVPGDNGQPASMVGARSGPVSGTIVQAGVNLSGIGIDSALIVNIESAGGDSGAALLDSGHHVIGFLVGEADGGPFNGLKIFCSAASVVHQLNVDF